MKEIIERFDKSQPILELAAGSGALTQQLIDNDFCVDPVDLSDSSWRVSSIKPIVADFNIPGWERSLARVNYSQIVAIEVIEHLDNPRQFFRDLYTLLLPGGKLIVTTPNPLSSMSVALSLTQERYYVFDRQCYLSIGHVTAIPPWMLGCHAEDAGFSVSELKSVCEPEFDSWWKASVYTVWQWLVIACRRGSGMSHQIVLAVLKKDETK
jgi:2-polyprenyl-3-methyl-5-hydroxy-6-metoxy-1,4-benzoquinol methylase